MLGWSGIIFNYQQKPFERCWLGVHLRMNTKETLVEKEIELHENLLHHTTPWLQSMNQVSHERNFPLIKGFHIYGEHSSCIQWTFSQTTVIYESVLLASTSFFEEKKHDI